MKRSENPIFLNEFLDYISTIQNKSKSTIKEYNYDLKHFFQYIVFRYNNDELPDYVKEKTTDINQGIKLIDISKLQSSILKDITLADIHSFLHHLKLDFDVTSATIGRKVASIKSFFNYICTVRKTLDINPTTSLETPKLEKRLPRYLDLQEAVNLLDTTKIANSNKEISKTLTLRNNAIITLFLNCGLRLGELIAINVDDINFFDNTLNVIGKGNKERSIYLNKACVKSLQDYLEVRNKIKDPKEEKALFLSTLKKRISRRAVQNMLDTEIKKSNISKKNITPHKLRHTAATLMFQYGDVDIRSIQTVLGHASISTTEIYTHVNSQQVKNAISKNPLADEGVEEEK